MKRRDDPSRTAREEIEDDLRRTRLLMAQAYAGFNAVADQEMVESYIYEIQALRLRYSCLLRRRKALEPPEPVPVAGREARETVALPGLWARPALPSL